MKPDYAHLQRVVLAWRALRGMSQADVYAAGGPSDTTLGSIEAGKWSSRAPADTLRKLDRGFGWPEGTARQVLYEGFDPIESWPTGRPVGVQAPLEFGPDAEWMFVLEERLTERRKRIDLLERQKADLDYQIRSLQIEIDYLLRERTELMHVAAPKGADLFYVDDDGNQHAVEIKRHSPDDEPDSASERSLPRAARPITSVGRALRRAQDEAAEESQDES